MAGFDLDVDAPQKVPAILRRAAQRYAEDASELDSSWQDRSAGKPWRAIARVLERAADTIERAVGR